MQVKKKAGPLACERGLTMPAKRRVVTGEYNRNGYVLYLDGRFVYSAGNAPGDSTVRVPVARGVALRTLRRFCHGSALDLAKDKSAEYGGIERVPDQDEREG